LVLLNQLDPARCPLAPMQEGDLARRAELMLQNADKLGCRKFISPQDVTNVRYQLNTIDSNNYNYIN
jgi:plastin-1